MTRRSEQISLHLNAYLTAHSSPPDAVLRELANETVELFPTEMGLAIAPEQGTLMTLLTQLTGAVSAIEIGTFTGYSSICIARGLAVGGRLVCCDISEEWTSVARKYWEKAGLDSRIDLRLGRDAERFHRLPQQPLAEVVDVPAATGDQARILLAPQRLPDVGLAVCRGAFGGRAHDETPDSCETLAPFTLAASRTALTMLW